MTTTEKQKPKFDLHQTVTDRIVAMLETCKEDSSKRPWVPTGRQTKTPSNVFTGAPYRGTNVLLLWMEAERQGYESSLWASYDQFFRLGGGVKEEGKGRFGKILKPSRYNVRRGETGTMIVYAKKFEGDPGNPDDKGAFMLRYSTVFNVSQVDGWDGGRVKSIPALTERHAGAEEFLRHTLADFAEGYDNAYYSPILDHIRMPAPGQFRDTKTGTAMEHYYSTRFHEYVHWTAQQDRLNRGQVSKLFLETYAFEELVAELGAAFLCAHLGITATPREDHAVYIRSWLKALKNDKKLVFAASSAAQKAVDFLIDKQPNNVPAVDVEMECAA